MYLIKIVDIYKQQQMNDNYQQHFTNNYWLRNMYFDFYVSLFWTHLLFLRYFRY